MIILDEKEPALPPPPPYDSSSSLINAPPPPFPSQRAKEPPNLSSLPPHILLYIVHQTLPQSDGPYDGERKVERQRKVLYWMTIGLRLVSRSLYIACMHVLRSTYLPAYTSLIRPPYSSDPFPFTSTKPYHYNYRSNNSSLPSPLTSLQRETQVLDLFISLKVREDVWADDTELHLERDESFKDLFDLMQPRARLEDLLRQYGVQAGVLSVGNTIMTSSGCVVVSSRCSASATTASPASGPSTPRTPKFPSSSSSSPQRLSFSPTPSLSSLRACVQRTPTPTSSTFPISSTSTSSTATKPSSSQNHVTKQHLLPFNALSISFNPRSVGIIFATRSTGKRTIVEVSRRRDEKLESSAKKLVVELQKWLNDRDCK